MPEPKIQRIPITIDETETYKSKECIIFHKIPMKNRNTIPGGVASFIKQIVKSLKQSSHFEATHALSPYT